MALELRGQVGAADADVALRLLAEPGELRCSMRRSIDTFIQKTVRPIGDI